MKYQTETPDASLNCRASGCPLRWSVSTEGRHQLCSYHAWTETNQWPEITQRLQMDGPWLLTTKRAKVTA